MARVLAILSAIWHARRREEPTRLECWRALVAAPEPAIKPIARGIR